MKLLKKFLTISLISCFLFNNVFAIKNQREKSDKFYENKNKFNSKSDESIKERKNLFTFTLAASFILCVPILGFLAYKVFVNQNPETQMDEFDNQNPKTKMYEFERQIIIFLKEILLKDVFCDLGSYGPFDYSFYDNFELLTKKIEELKKISIDDNKKNYLDGVFTLIDFLYSTVSSCEINIKSLEEKLMNSKLFFEKAGETEICNLLTYIYNIIYNLDEFICSHIIDDSIIDGSKLNKNVLNECILKISSPKNGKDFEGFKDLEKISEKNSFIYKILFSIILIFKVLGCLSTKKIIMYIFGDKFKDEIFNDFLEFYIIRSDFFEKYFILKNISYKEIYNSFIFKNKDLLLRTKKIFPIGRDYNNAHIIYSLDLEHECNYLEEVYNSIFSIKNRNKDLNSFKESTMEIIEKNETEKHISNFLYIITNIDLFRDNIFCLGVFRDILSDDIFGSYLEIILILKFITILLKNFSKYESYSYYYNLFYKIYNEIISNDENIQSIIKVHKIDELKLHKEINGKIIIICKKLFENIKLL